MEISSTSKHIGLTVISTIVLCMISFAMGRSCGSAPIPTENVEVISSVTTEEEVADPSPIARDSVVLRYRYVEVPIESASMFDSAVSLQDEVHVIAEADTATVVIPITQKKYETDDYRAYVSGYRQSLDSIFVTRKTYSITLREKTRPTRLSIGFQGGYGMTPKGFQPYLGIGVTVNLWSK